MARLTVEDLIDRGPDFVRDFVRQPHGAEEFVPEFSWLLLAEAVGLEIAEARQANPALAARWAAVAAGLYEGLARECRPQDHLARDIWTKWAARYRAQAAGSAPPPSAPPEVHEPHPI